MAKHHLTHKEPGWRTGLFINGIGAFLSLRRRRHHRASPSSRDGAWVIIVLVPIMVVVLVRLNRQYEAEDDELDTRTRQAPPRRRSCAATS